MTFLPIALAASLALPARAASSDAEFEAQLAGVRKAVAVQNRDLRDRPRILRVTQESGPKDPILLAQKPLLDLIKKVETSVVFLKMDGPAGGRKPSSGACTGFFTDASKELGRPAVITTNAHCVEHLGAGAEVQVGLYDGDDNRPRMTKGRVLAHGSSELAKDIAFVELADPSLNRRGLPLWSKLDRGEQVIAIGNPLGMTFSVSRGIVSALERDRLGDQFVLEMNQSDVAVNPGNSGGPLFNMWGSVVGINTMIASQSGGFEGISLSVPAHHITLAMRQYARTGNLTPGAVQVEVAASTDTQRLTVRKVVAGGAAEKARMLAGDELFGVDGVDLAALPPERAMKAFLVHLKFRSPGETVTVTVRRGGRDLTLRVTLDAAKPPEPPRPEWAPIPKKDKSGPTSFAI